MPYSRPNPLEEFPEYTRFYTWGKDRLQEAAAVLRGDTLYGDTGLRREFWVAEYLEENQDQYRIELVEDLDMQIVESERGDYLAKYNGEKVVLEVEKSLDDFRSHGHRTSEDPGWDDQAGINIVFAAQCGNTNPEELPIPVIIADDFESWYLTEKSRNMAKHTILRCLLELSLDSYQYEPDENILHEHTYEILQEEHIEAIRASAKELFTIFERSTSDEFKSSIEEAQDTIREQLLGKWNETVHNCIECGLHPIYRVETTTAYKKKKPYSESIVGHLSSAAMKYVVETDEFVRNWEDHEYETIEVVN